MGYVGKVPVRISRSLVEERGNVYFFMYRSDYSKEVGGQFIRIRLKIAKKCGLYLDIF